MRLIVFLVMAIQLSAGDVTVVENPEKAPNQKTLVFSEDLRFGGDEKQNYSWWSVNPVVAAAPNGHIFVADPSEQRIMEYDAKGQWLRQIGNLGAGPGEFRQLNLFHVSLDGSAIAVDAFEELVTLSHYSKALVFTERTRPVNRLNRAFFSPDGKLAGVEMLKGREGTVEIINGITDLAGNLKHSVHTTVIPSWDSSKASDPKVLGARLSVIIFADEGPRGLMGFGFKGDVYTALSSTYEITQWSADLKTKKRIIRKAYKPLIRSDKDVEAAVEALTARFKENIAPLAHIITKSMIAKSYAESGLKGTYDPLNGLLVMPDGHLLAVHPPNKDGVTLADIFDESGKLVGETHLPQRQLIDSERKPRMVFRNGFAYTLKDLGDNGFEMVRYTYAWK